MADVHVNRRARRAVKVAAGVDRAAGLSVADADADADAGSRACRRGVRECCCNESWVDFTQNTSLHGLKYIWLPNTLAARRLLWLVLTMLCVSVMSYQIGERVLHYYSWPVTVNVKVNYNKTLLFPTVTLCNQNTFRASRAADLEYYDLLTSMYTDTFTAAHLCTHNATSLTLRDLLTETSHRPEDLIVSCSWKGEKCGPENFTETLSDHGVCYTFNLPPTQEHALQVSSPGAENALTMTLNVEQYEYMPGPHDAAGVKIFIHDPIQFPKVNQLGIVLPTGSHSFLGLELISVENLGPPHGQCDSPSLQYFPDYSLENCQVECFTRLLYARCACRLFYMPHIHGEPPLCSLYQRYDCYMKHAEELRAAMMNYCQCPVPCNFQIFDATVSYATTSTFVIDRFLSNANRSTLRKRYQRARDVTNRHQLTKANSLEKILLELRKKVEYIKTRLTGELHSRLENQRSVLERVSEREMSDWLQTYTYFRYQNYILQKNLVRARDAMDERTFSILAHGVQEFAFSIETKIQQLAEENLNDSSVRNVLYLLAKNQLNARLDIARRTRQNYTQLITGFLNASSIFNYKFSYFRRNESDLVLPKQLLAEAFTHSDSVRKRSLRVEKDIISMAYWMKQYGKLAATAYFNNTLNLTKLYMCNVNFLRTSREYLQSRSMLFDDFIQWPVLQLDAREENFLTLKGIFMKMRDGMFGYLDNVHQIIVDIQASLLNNMSKGINMCDIYLHEGKISKTEVAEFIISETLQAGANRLKILWESLRRRCEQVRESWSGLSATTQEIWNVTLNEENLMRYWRYKNISRYLRKHTVVMREVNEEFNQYRSAMESSCELDNAEEELLAAFVQLTEHMRQFEQSSHVDASFVRDNFLKVDIFYRELNYEKITQQKAYDVFALLCDIGGAMGLFIGASVMTVFEIIDLIMYHTVMPPPSRTK